MCPMPESPGTWRSCRAAWAATWAVTGATLDAAGALHAGLADRYLPDAALPALIEALRHEHFGSGAEVVARIAAEAARHKVVPTPDTSWLADSRESIERHFSRPDLASILASMDGERDCAALDRWVEQTGHAMRERLSPLSMAMSLQAVDRAGDSTLAEALRRDLDLTRSGAARGDVLEGVRAMLVDKDRAPR